MPRAKKTAAALSRPRQKSSPLTQRPASGSRTAGAIGSMSCVLTGHDFVESLIVNAGTASGGKIIDWLASPTQIPGRLSELARLYERFHFRRLSLQYVPVVSKLEPGAVVWGYDNDVWDDLPIGAGAIPCVLANQSSGMVPVSDRYTYRVRLDGTVPLCYCSAEDVTAGSEMRLDFQGQLIILWAGDAVTTTKLLGHLYVDYEIEFRNPQYQRPTTTTIGSDIPRTVSTIVEGPLATALATVAYAGGVPTPDSLHMYLPGSPSFSGSVDTTGLFGLLSGRARSFVASMPNYPGWAGILIPSAQYRQITIDYDIGRKRTTTTSGQVGSARQAAPFQIWSWNGSLDNNITENIIQAMKTSNYRGLGPMRVNGNTLQDWSSDSAPSSVSAGAASVTYDVPLARHLSFVLQNNTMEDIYIYWCDYIYPTTIPVYTGSYDGVCDYGCSSELVDVSAKVESTGLPYLYYQRDAGDSVPTMHPAYVATTDSSAATSNESSEPADVTATRERFRKIERDLVDATTARDVQRRVDLPARFETPVLRRTGAL